MDNNQCKECNNKFENEELIWYCNDCKIYICDICMKKHINHDIEFKKYSNKDNDTNIQQKRLCAYCDDCEIFININEIIEHSEHNISFFEAEPNISLKQTLFNIGGSGPSKDILENKTIPFNKIKEYHFSSKSLKEDFLNHLPVLIIDKTILSLDNYNNKFKSLPGVYVLLMDNKTIKEIKHDDRITHDVNVKIEKDKIKYNKNDVIIPINIKNKKKNYINNIKIFIYSFDSNELFSINEIYYKSDWGNDTIFFKEKNIGKILSNSIKTDIINLNRSKKVLLDNSDNFNKTKIFLESSNHLNLYFFIIFYDFLGVHYYSYVDNAQINLLDDIS